MEGDRDEAKRHGPDLGGHWGVVGAKPRDFEKRYDFEVDSDPMLGRSCPSKWPKNASNLRKKLWVKGLLF